MQKHVEPGHQGNNQRHREHYVEKIFCVFLAPAPCNQQNQEYRNGSHHEPDNRRTDSASQNCVDKTLQAGHVGDRSVG